MELNKVKESQDSQNVAHHRVVSTDKILSSNIEDIKQLITIIANKYKISTSDAAFALTNVFKKISA